MVVVQNNKIRNKTWKIQENILFIREKKMVTISGFIYFI